MKIILRAAMVAAFLCAGIDMAGAQIEGRNPGSAPNQGPAPNNQVQANARNGNGVPAPQQQPQPGSSAAPGTLSHELNRSGGVLYPPPTGDGGVIAPPNQGTSSTPVIPPPGSPGGNPRVQPK
ncbi:MAG TPA: hypothetical protein VJ770_21325 [Stellaceae bacterium]|nr:hypothetical protein [Stellaceae bacterium]